MDTPEKVPINAPSLGEEEINAVRAVMETGILTSWRGDGPMVTRFEEEFADYVGVREAVAVNSGTAALHTALLASGIGEGDEVVIPSFTFVATANAVLLARAKPVFADVDDRSFNIDPLHVEKLVTERTKAVMPVHVFGQPADMDVLLEIAETHGLDVIEDAAQAHGAIYRQRAAGSVGRVGCFSFYGSKNLTTGEGGMITTNDVGLAERARKLRSHGQRIPYVSEDLGRNYRMPELEAAIGSAQLKKLDEFLERRRRNAAYLTQSLEGVEGIELPYVMEGVVHAFYVYTVKVYAESYGMSRDDLWIELDQTGVGAAVYWPVPVHLMPLYRRLLDHSEGDLPVTERLVHQVLSLPVHPAVTQENLDTMIRVVIG